MIYIETCSITSKYESKTDFFSTKILFKTFWRDNFNDTYQIMRPIKTIYLNESHVKTII